MTLRIPKVLLIVLGVLLLAGAGVAAYFTLIESDEVCYSDAGDQVDCSEEGALSEAEYDELQAQEAQAQRKVDRCEQEIGHILKDSQELNARLDVGLTFEQYSEQVGNISVAYDEISVNKLDPECTFDVAVHLEEALNSYIKADNLWNDCLTDFSCRTNSIDPTLQDHWLDASSNIDDAEQGLSDLGGSEASAPDL